MEFFRQGLYLDVMKYRKIFVTLSTVLVIATVVGFFWPGPNYGTDFRGGTELELQFRGRVSAAELRAKLGELGYTQADVVAVTGRNNQYMIRVPQVSALTKSQVQRVRTALRSGMGEARVEEMKVSPGGDEISLDLSAEVDPEVLTERLQEAGVRVRAITPFGRAEDHRYEASLFGMADEILRGLQTKLGNRAPAQPLRVEWVGPKAGAQLRDAAVKSLLYSIVFIMIYVAFRFDLRFAPGGAIALIHDAVVTAGFLIFLGKEINLTTVAALLTIVGYSINDTIVIYDRIRENMQRMRDKSLRELINVSTSQMMSRTIITSSTVLLSLIPFFIWGTPQIRDFVFAIVIGIVCGVYSTIYIAAPVTEWMDRKFFSKLG